MKRNACILFLFCAIALINSGCQKEFNQVQDLHSDCIMKTFSVPSWYTDSIFYENNKITRIEKSYRKNSDTNMKALFEYNSGEVKIVVSNFVSGIKGEDVNYTLTYDGTKISQIETSGDRLKANYYYSGDKLIYILYHWQGSITDSVAVEYEGSGNNIRDAKWFKFDHVAQKLVLGNEVVYSYDSKNNPHRNSLHFLYNFYDCKEFSLDYFNLNNIQTIGSSISNLHTEYMYNEYDYPTNVVFYDDFEQETDRNAMEYESN